MTSKRRLALHFECHGYRLFWLSWVGSSIKLCLSECRKWRAKKAVEWRKRKSFWITSILKKVSVDVSSITRKQDALEEKFEMLALEMQCMPRVWKDAKNLIECVFVLKKSSNEESLKWRARHMTADMEMVAKLARMDRAEHTARNAIWDNDDEMLKGKLNVLESFNNGAGSRYSFLFHGCNSV